MELFQIIFISYLMGSMPFGFLLAKLFLKIDIREIGSGNIGATNVLRTGNKFIGYGTLILDIVKAVIPVLISKFYFEEYIYISALAVFIGHVFPIWLKFKGGKGVATYVGILFCINIYLGLVFIISWLIIFLFSKFSSLASILATLVVPVYTLFNNDFENKYFFVIMFILIFYTHKENVKRLINKEESKTKIY